MKSSNIILEAFEVHNFTLFGRERLSLHPQTTVLVGRNDAGKSLLLQAISLYGAIQKYGFRGPLADESFHTSGEKVTKFIAEWAVDGTRWRHSIKLDADSPEEKLECDGRFWSWNPKERILTTENREYIAKEIDRYKTFAQIDVSKWRLDTEIAESVYKPLAIVTSFDTPSAYLFEPSALGMRAPLDMKDPQRNGYGWSLWLQEIINRRNDDLADLERTVRGLFPFFGQVLVREKRIKIEQEVSELGRPQPGMGASSLQPASLESAKYLIDVLKREASVREVFVELHSDSTTGEAARIEAADVSSGILLTLAHLALVYANEGGKLLLLEEPENGLNPKITLDMMQALLRVVVQRGEQLVLTTHNSWWLDLVPANAIRVITRDAEGAYIKVPDHEALSKLREELDIYPSELMSLHGPEALVAAGKFSSVSS